MPAFDRYIGIDYSGAEVPTASLKGLRVYMSEGGAEAREVPPPPGPKWYWTRKGIAEWLLERFQEDMPTLAGIDHGFSFPLRYFEVDHLEPIWQTFLEDFLRHWPTDKKYVESIREGYVGNAQARSGNARWRRIAEVRAGAKSVFHFDVPGSVAKSTHAGLPWLLYLCQRVHDRVHFWPFDGWDIPAGRSALAEVDPSQGFTPWLYRIAHNESANHARSRARRREQGWAPEDLERLPDPMGSTPESRLAEQNEGQRIRQALDTLPARHIHVPVGDHGRKGGKHPDRKITGISGNSAH